jgi:hypothetical protein
MARSMATPEPVFDNLDIFALWMLRELETPTEEMGPKSDIKLDIRIAAIWIEIVGARSYGFDYEFGYSPGKGDSELGGPLWGGKHGFCMERWKLWGRRFGEVANADGEIAEEVIRAAREVEARMLEIEAEQIE